MPSIRQTNFLGGELDPRLWGRNDLELFQKGLRTCRNFFISPHGAAVSRPGTTYVGTTKPNSNAVRLVPFYVSDSESYVLEFSEASVRVYQNGARVSLTGSGTTGGDLDYIPALSFSIDFNFMQWAQVGDVLRIVDGRGYYWLKRTAAGSPPTFTVEIQEFYPDPREPWFINVTTQTNVQHTPYLYNAGDTWLFAETDEHPAREWTWWVSAIVQKKSTGVISETLPFRVVKYSNAASSTLTNIPDGHQIVLASDHAVTVAMDFLPADSSANTSYVVLSYLYYRGRGDIAGFVGTSKTTLFVDDGREPDYSLQPLRGTNPTAAPYTADGDSPARCVGFFQERLVLGGFTAWPSTLKLSATGNYPNFDVPFITFPTQSLEYELASRRRETIRAFLAHQRLLVGTDSSIWSIGGSAGPLSATDVVAQVEDEVGIAANIPFLLANGIPMFVRAKGRGVRGLSVNQSGSGYGGVDLSWQSQHLLLGNESLPTSDTRQITRWAFQEDPYPIVWAVRDDGILLSMTVAPTGEAAWARHDGEGEVRDVCVVPEDGEDGVYLLVERDTGTFIERMNSRVANGSPLDFGSVDSAVVFGGASGAAPSLAITGLTHLEGENVYFTAKDNVPQGPYRVVGGAITLDHLPLANVAGGVIGFTGMLFTPELELLDAISRDTRTQQKTVVSVGFEVDEARGLAIGQDSDNLTEWQQHSVSDGYLPPPPATSIVKTLVVGSWDINGRAFIRQTKPLPVTILGVVRELDTGG